MRLIALGFAFVLLAFVGAVTVPANANDARLAALPAPSLTSPTDGTLLPNMGFIVLEWSLPTGATQYQIQVTPANNDGPGINLIRDAATTYTIDPPVLGAGPYVLLPGMSYSWRLRATDQTVSVGEDDPDWGGWSDAWTFRTPAPSSAGIAVVAPAGGSTVTTLAPELTWSDTAASIFYYEVQLTKDAQFRTTPATAVAAVYQNLVHGGQSNPVNTWTVPAAAALEPGTQYFWRVRPRVQGDGVEVGWSGSFTFDTPVAATTPTPAATPSTSPTAAATFVASPTPTPGPGTPTATPANTPASGTPTVTPGPGAPTATPANTPASGTPTATPVLSTCDWTGTWSTNAGGNMGFQQTGSQITGVFNGTDQLTNISATSSGISGNRAVASGWTDFSLTASADCGSFTGIITTPFPAFDIKPIAGTRTSATPPPIPTAAAASPTALPSLVCNMSGDWDAMQTLTPSNPWTRRLVLSHTGTAITGTIDGAGSITGTLLTNRFEGTWSSGGESGTFSLGPLFGCGNYFGSWDRLAPSVAKDVVAMTKVP